MLVGRGDSPVIVGLLQLNADRAPHLLTPEPDFAWLAIPSAVPRFPDAATLGRRPQAASQGTSVAPPSPGRSVRSRQRRSAASTRPRLEPTPWPRPPRPSILPWPSMPAGRATGFRTLCPRQAAYPRRRCRTVTVSGPTASSPGPAARTGFLPEPSISGPLPYGSCPPVHIGRLARDTYRAGDSV